MYAYTVLVSLTKNKFSLKEIYLIGLPAELGGVFIGLILSTYHWVLFFVAITVAVLFYYCTFKYLYKLAMYQKGCIEKLFYYQVILAQIIFISCVLLFMKWIL